jgi:tight adherence protein B
MDVITNSAIIFCISILIIELLFYAFRSIRNPDRARIKKELRKMASKRQGEALPDILRKKVISDVPAFNEILLRISGIEYLDRLRSQASTQYSTGFFILLSLFLAASGFTGLYVLLKKGIWLSVIFALLIGSLPVFYLYVKKHQRLKKFQTQLPEALDLMARSLRAGHAFSTGMNLAADEFDDPLGTEFNVTLGEINFGIGVAEALTNLAGRVDCADLRFFVVAVILQRETGGNLADIMENIAYLIRERFKLYGRVQTLAAEGKLSMWVLIALPFLIVGALFIINPTYIKILFYEPVGRIMCGGAILMMLMGFFVMKRMVNIKV